MRNIHNIWAVICCCVSVASFVAGRWTASTDLGLSALTTVTSPKTQVKTGGTEGSDPLPSGVVARQSTNINSAEPSPENFPPPPPLAPQLNASRKPSIQAPRLTPEMMVQHNKANEDLKKEIAQLLRKDGLSEEEIKTQLEAQFPPDAPPPEEPPGPPGEMMPEQPGKETQGPLPEAGEAPAEVAAPATAPPPPPVPEPKAAEKE